MLASQKKGVGAWQSEIVGILDVGSMMSSAMGGI
jgi:hypothetical protein